VAGCTTGSGWKPNYGMDDENDNNNNNMNIKQPVSPLLACSVFMVTGFSIFSFINLCFFCRLDCILHAHFIHSS
jgi:hypothetical protein